jgi:hypothetical protein
MADGGVQRADAPAFAAACFLEAAGGNQASRRCNFPAWQLFH